MRTEESSLYNLRFPIDTSLKWQGDHLSQVQEAEINFSIDILYPKRQFSLQ